MSQRALNPSWYVKTLRQALAISGRGYKHGAKNDKYRSENMFNLGSLLDAAAKSPVCPCSFRHHTFSASNCKPPKQRSSVTLFHYFSLDQPLSSPICPPPTLSAELSALAGPCMWSRDTRHLRLLASAVDLSMTEMQTVAIKWPAAASIERGQQLCARASHARPAGYLQWATGCLLGPDKVNCPGRIWMRHSLAKSAPCCLHWHSAATVTQPGGRCTVGHWLTAAVPL